MGGPASGLVWSGAGVMLQESQQKAGGRTGASPLGGEGGCKAVGEGFGVWWQESDMKGQATTVGGGGQEDAAPPRVWGGVVGGGVSRCPSGEWMPPPQGPVQDTFCAHQGYGV